MIIQGAKPYSVRVTSIKRNAGKYQLLLAKGINIADQSTMGLTYVLKALRAGNLEKHHVKSHLEWLRATDLSEGYAIPAYQ